MTGLAQGGPAAPALEALVFAPPLGRVTRALHWGVGLSVLGLLAYGFWLQTLPSGPEKGPFVQLHKSFGMLVFVAALARLGWRVREGFPAAACAHGVWQRRGAVGMHLFLIAATMLMPVSGILRSLSYARPISVFGLPVIPQMFAAKNEALHVAASAFHDWLALALTAAIALHVAAALKHHLLDGDPTLARMIGRRERLP